MKRAQITLLLFLIIISPVSASTVCDLGCDFTTIQGAIEAASAYETIDVLAGTYSENIEITKPIYLVGAGYDVTNVIASYNRDDTIAVSSDNVTISGLNISGASRSSKSGIYLNGVTGITISDNYLTGNVYGLYLYNSSNNILMNNKADYNVDYGFYLRYSPQNNIDGGTAIGNDYGGIYLGSGGNDNNIFQNVIINNGPSYGIYAYGDTISIINCTLSYNGEWNYATIWVQGDEAVITRNVISDNYGVGIVLDGHYNLIYDNFFNNTADAIDEYSSSNNEYNIDLAAGTNIVGGNYLGGNYYARPDGTGYSETCSDADFNGICDNPYAINDYDSDYYPLTITEVNDADHDGIPDGMDNCPATSNEDQANADGDSRGDACDNCPTTANDQANSDGDTWGDACDNCPYIDNQEQDDNEGDGLGDFCDIDDDNDGYDDGVDNCHWISNPGQEDTDSDTIGDACDAYPYDFDNDGYDDDSDNCPDLSNPAQEDDDGDGFGDVCDACPGTTWDSYVDSSGCLWCHDSDDGNDTETFGTVTINDGSTYDDVCDGSTLREYHCLPYDTGSTHEYVDVVCENCHDGYCEPVVAPIISEIVVNDITSASARISFLTYQETSNNRVLYGESADLLEGIWSVWDNSTIYANILLQGLLPSTEYYYRCYSYNGFDPWFFSSSDLGSFTTLRLPKTITVDDDLAQFPEADFSSLADAIADSINGDTILVYPGTYDGGQVITNQLTITGIGYPVIDSLNMGSGFWVKADHVTIEGFSFKNAGVVNLGGSLPDTISASIKLGRLATSRYAVIRDNEFTGPGGPGIYLGTSAAHNIVTDNEFEERILIESGDYNNITNNHFNYSGLHPAIALDVYISSYKTTGNVISSNEFVDASEGIVIQSGAERTIVKDNELRDVFDGIRNSGDGTEIVGNMLTGRGVLDRDSKGIDNDQGLNAILMDNSVELFNIGIRLYGYEDKPVNGSLRNNTMMNNQFNLFIDSEGIDSWDMRPYYEDFDYDIDPSNLVDGKHVYYLKDIEGAVVDPASYPDAGFIACINCTDVTIEGHALEDNGQGILLFGGTGILIQDVVASRNYKGGLYALHSDNVTVDDSSFRNNGAELITNIVYGTGIYLGRTHDSTINDVIVETNWENGIMLYYSYNNTLSGSTILDNGVSGVDLDRSEGNLLTGNNISNEVWGDQEYGVYLSSSPDNTIYDNYFDNPINARSTSADTWNIVKTEGTNIVGGPYLGGNYWSDYTGNDTDGDYLGDTQLPYNASEEIMAGGDYHPLLRPQAMPEAELTIISPRSTSYVARDIPLQYEFTGEADTETIMLDGSAVDSLTRLTLGEHVLEVIITDNVLGDYTASVVFTISPLAFDNGLHITSDEYPDEASVSFIGRPSSYELSFEAITYSEVGVYLNKRLNGTIGKDPSIFDTGVPGMFVATLPEAFDWTRFSFTIEAENISAGTENIVSFIHSENPFLNEPTGIWKVRNITMKPLLGFNYTWMELSVGQKAASPGTELPLYVNMLGSGVPGIEAYIYYMDPNGNLHYYPDWDEEPLALEDYYLENDFAGRLASTITLDGTDGNGRYVVIGKIIDKENNLTLSLSADDFYFSNTTEIRLSINDKTFGSGADVAYGYAVIADTYSGEADMLFSLEKPDGDINYASVSYDPLYDDYAVLYEDTVDALWQEGTYIIRALLFDDELDVLAEDSLTFDVCLSESGVIGRYFEITGSGPEFMQMDSCSIRFIDANTIKPTDEYGFDGLHDAFEATIPPGEYAITGSCTDEDDNEYIIRDSSITVTCGDVAMTNVELLGMQDVLEADAEYAISAAAATMEAESYEEESNIFYIGGYAGSSEETTSQSPELLLAGYLTLPDDTDDGFVIGYYEQRINLLASNDAESLAASCPKPKILVMMPKITAENLSYDKSLINNYYVGKLRTLNGDQVEIISMQDIGSLLSEYEEQVLGGAKSNEVTLSADINDKINVEYLLTISINQLGSTYGVNSVLLDVDNAEAVARKEYLFNSEDQLLYNIESMAVTYSNLNTRVTNWEQDHPLPPRAPFLTYTLDPAVVDPTIEDRRSTVTATVTDCRGNAVEGTTVYFKDHTIRGETKASADASYPYDDYVYAKTSEEGKAQATYLLTKGLYAGKDKISTFTKARGMKKAWIMPEITINGIGMDVDVDKTELSTKEKTRVQAFLYTIDETGTKVPLAGKTITVQVYQIRDGQIEPGQVTTDENGLAQLEFTAGDLDGGVKFALKYWPTGFDDELWVPVILNIKKDEYILKIRWKEHSDVFGAFNYEFNQGTNGHEYTFSLDSKTVFDLESGREETDARASFQYDWESRLELLNSYYTCADYNDNGCVSPERVTYWTHKDGQGNGDVNAVANDYASTKDILREDMEGNLVINIEPLMYKMVRNGNYEYTWSGSGSESGSIDYAGMSYYPNPQYYPYSILSHPKLDPKRAVYNGPWIEEDTITLKKLSDGKYESFHYVYRPEHDIWYLPGVGGAYRIRSYEVHGEEFTFGISYTLLDGRQGSGFHWFGMEIKDYNDYFREFDAEVIKR